MQRNGRFAGDKRGHALPVNGSQSPMKRERKGYLLRIEEGLLEDLNRWASSEFRSVNGQIELVLKRAVEDWKKGQGSTKSGT